MTLIFWKQKTTSSLAIELKKKYKELMQPETFKINLLVVAPLRVTLS
jgi:hypothetical protein